MVSTLLGLALTSAAAAGAGAALEGSLPELLSFAISTLMLSILEEVHGVGGGGLAPSAGSCWEGPGALTNLRSQCQADDQLFVQ